MRWGSWGDRGGQGGERMEGEAGNGQQIVGNSWPSVRGEHDKEKVRWIP